MIPREGPSPTNKPLNMVEHPVGEQNPEDPGILTYSHDTWLFVSPHPVVGQVYQHRRGWKAWLGYLLLRWGYYLLRHAPQWGTVQLSTGTRDQGILAAEARKTSPGGGIESEG